MIALKLCVEVFWMSTSRVPLLASSLRTALVLLSLSVWFGCLIGEEPLDAKNQKGRTLVGTYQSSEGKVIVFNNKSIYKLYLLIEDFRAGKPPDTEARYSILNNQIIFYDDEGNEIAERGILDSKDASFSWLKYPNEPFRKQP